MLCACNYDSAFLPFGSTSYTSDVRWLRTGALHRRTKDFQRAVVGERGSL
jgi:hypothetical protein